ncbi:tetratricopeptide repeat-containing sulfotransferase family protein [Arsukibacterium ikkense]|uniref:tetratricopeptide repeat-containing sulfotransferase family protein n=1 Tax=Arsukibacterium ikkense TaxID=336831 RepID=UPI00069AC72D|nr:sulfotransferase [Arsukibacterium ikkense]
MTLSPDQQLAEAARMLRCHEHQLAIPLCQQVLQLQPDNINAWRMLFELYRLTGNYQLLAQCSLQAIQRLPEFPAAIQAACMALRQLQQHQQAIKLLQDAIKQYPAWAELQLQLGLLYKETGDFSAALAAFNQAIALAPSLHEAYWLRADMLKQPTAAEISQLRQQLTRPELTDDARAQLHYALARALEFQHNYAASFAELTAGAAAKRRSLHYDHAAELAEHRRSSAPFGQQRFATACNSDVTPIFICGLPRSGSTLAEHILSSHPAVRAGDELFDLAQATRDVLSNAQQQQPFPLWAASMSDEQWHQLGQRYLERTRHLHSNGYFTDKMPLNYKAIGIIAKALPQAKIIHCQRHPMDTLFSCYKQLFADGIAFSYDLTELAEIYQAHQTLMQQWQQLLPGRIYQLRYERLIRQQQAETARLLAFIGLDWAESCLTFHQNPRAVYTVSSTQVRQPLFSSSLGFWQHYQPQLAGLATLLAEDIRQYQQQLPPR